MREPARRQALAQLHYEALGMETTGTFECALVVAGFVRLNPLEPHHATALRARGVFQVVDKPFHREIKAQNRSMCRLSNLYRGTSQPRQLRWTEIG